MSNDNLILISGSSATGKSACLRNLANPEGVMYLNTESNKKLPFSPVKFDQYNIIDPNQVIQAFTAAETMPAIHTIIVDSLTFMFDQYVSLYVLNAPKADGFKAWGNFQQFFKTLMQQHVATSTKNVIFLAHTETILNESDMAMETKVPVQGGLKKNGIESYFSTVISTKRMATAKLDKYKSDLLTINEEEQEDEFKYCFQTRLTKETMTERIRAPMGMFGRNETYTDNDVQLILNHLHNYYN
jgi:hypothetical protein|tara:strand:- start:1014 stop:1742 length:729 start_codon:yes stop_codon:yes gene_type:complete